MKYKLLLLLLIALQLFFIFKDVKGNDFIFIHDEFLTFSYDKSVRSLFVQQPIDFGSANTTVMLITLFDRAYYLLVFAMGFSLYNSQILMYLLKFVLLLFIPYIGFSKLQSFYNTKNNQGLVTFLISLWYSYNTFTLIYWHGNAFSLTLLLSYSLVPIALYLFHKSILGKEDPYSLYKVLFALVFFLMSFALYFYIVLLIFLVIYFIFYFFGVVKENRIYIIRNLIKIGVIYLPLISLHLLIPYEMLYAGSDTINSSGGETFGSLQGGLLYQLLMWFSWGIYTKWEPKYIYTFADYFRSLPSLLVPLVLYVNMLWGTLKAKKNLLAFILLLTFCIFIFFAKGAQDPFGELYLFLINNVPIFRLFRTPDSKFGLGVIISVAVLLIVVANHINKKVLITSLAMAIVLQGWLVFSGIAILGENTDYSSDRVIHVPEAYKDVADVINSNSDDLGYVFPDPPQIFHLFTLTENEYHLGQDLLPMITKNPFVYVNSYGGMSSKAYKMLKAAVETSNLKDIQKFPIKYFLFRKDVNGVVYSIPFKNEIEERFKLIFKNELFDIYENPNYTAVASADMASVNEISPVKYSVTPNNVDGKVLTIHLNKSFNSAWRLYAYNPNSDGCISEKCSLVDQVFRFKDISFLFRPEIANTTHGVYNDYANEWKLGEPVTQGPLILFFKTQALFYLLLLIALGYSSLLLLYILVVKIRIYAVSNRSKYTQKTI